MSILVVIIISLDYYQQGNSHSLYIPAFTKNHHPHNRTKMKRSHGSTTEKGCRGLFFCMIEDCPNCEILLDLENVKFDERAKERSERKPPPETWKERKERLDLKRANKQTKGAKIQAKHDIKAGKLKTLSHFFPTKK
jgi:hypothetical protein